MDSYQRLNTLHTEYYLDPEQIVGDRGKGTYIDRIIIKMMHFIIMMTPIMAHRVRYLWISCLAGSGAWNTWARPS